MGVTNSNDFWRQDSAVECRMLIFRPVSNLSIFFPVDISSIGKKFPDENLPWMG